MQTFKPTRNLLSVAVIVALAACSSPEKDQPPTMTGTAIEQGVSTGPAAVAVPAVTDSLEEIMVTGSRILVAGEVRTGEQERQQKLVAATVNQAMQPAVVRFPDHPGPVAGNTENYAAIDTNMVHQSALEPVSTFSIDVDTGSYSNVRRFLNQGALPPRDAVRTEELVNYFTYDYAQPQDDIPFSFSTELAASPWHAGKHLLHIGVQATDPSATVELHSNLVFLVDVSGSMESPDKLGLLKTALKLLGQQLDAEDSVSIVVYAGASGVVLEPVAGNDTMAIAAALDKLQAGGSTNGAAGIELAYQLAEKQFIAGGINRVLLATDGDFNVGIADVETLKNLISEKRRSGISLTTLGFGTGNYNDALMEQLADAGNGNYAYIDNLNEARKVLVDQLGATLQTVAKDVKVQIEFNPAVVSEYRLVGYENRLLANEDFNNDRIDAGEIGAGHSVTALYEISLAGDAVSIDPLRYAQNPAAAASSGFSNELAWLKLRYKAPDGDVSRLVEKPVLVSEITDDISRTSQDYRFAAAVAGFSQLLREDTSLGNYGYEQVLNLATAARGDDDFGYRSEFISLVRTASALDGARR